METNELKSIEILKTGKWNGINVTSKDIDEMISNFNSGITKPYINIDHDEKYTEKEKTAMNVLSFGMVDELKRVGNSLYANFKEVPRTIAELIKKGSLRNRSIEFWSSRKPYFAADGTKRSNVLKAVSFFGQGIPAVSNLSDAVTVLEQENVPESETVTFKLEMKEGKKMPTVEIEKEEYQRLLADSAKVESFKSETETFQNEVETLKSKLGEVESEKLELEKFKSETEKREVERVIEEAESFANALIKEGKLLPKYREDVIEEFRSKHENKDALERYKFRMNEAGMVVDLGDVPMGGNDEGSGDIVEKYKSDAKTFEDPDKAEKAINDVMKFKNVDREKATELLGL